MLVILKRSADGSLDYSACTLFKLLTSTGFAPSQKKTSPTALGSISKYIWRIMLVMLDGIGHFDCDSLDGLVVSLHLPFQLPKPNGDVSLCPGKS